MAGFPGTDRLGVAGAGGRRGQAVSARFTGGRARRPVASRTVAREGRTGSGAAGAAVAAEGNGVAERFIRTLKENSLWVRTFATVAELVEALREFKRRYNGPWLIERHGFRTPSQARVDRNAAANRLESASPCRKVG